MFKVQLFCDVCHTACVEGMDIGSRTSTYKARCAAREAGWMYTNRVGWACARCTERPTLLQVGQSATYQGQLTTVEGEPLKGQAARILDVRETGTVHALFVDPAAGRWAQHPHWFFLHEFNMEQPDAQDDSDGRREGVGIGEPGAP